MKTSKFRVRLKDCGVRFRDFTLNDLSWEDWRVLADLTKYFDFDCQFSETGCRTQKITLPTKQAFMDYYYGRKPAWDAEVRRWKSKIQRNVMCCCRSCCNTMGWIMYMDKDIVPMMARYYNDKTGFWRPHKGCVLPRIYRSKTCIGFSCGTDSVKPRKTWRLLYHYFHCREESILKFHYENTGDQCGTISEVAHSLKTMILMERRKTIERNSQ